MHSRVTKVAASAATISLLAFGVVAFILARTGAAEKTTSSPTNLQSSARGTSRNLSLQPEAFKLSRRLGYRFKSGESSATMVGTLTTGGTERSVNITRRQVPAGEDVIVGIAGEAGTLAWNDVAGAQAIGTQLNEAQQTMLERVALDNPDQFVLAQLRGASYYTVARNVRSDVGGSDNYNSPLWDVVRVDEPQTQGARRLTANSRLYYINVQTGLIDKIASESNGETIEADVLEWSEQTGNKFPSHILWKRGNETVQEFRLTSVSIQAQQ
jgi:hypothetical protein